ncbi:tRNA (guanine(9)-N1)-methyltransferase [Tanacetum coccineum]
MNTITTTDQTHVNHDINNNPQQQQPLSKNAQKKLLKQQRFEARKAVKKALAKEEKKLKGEMKRKEWEEKLNEERETKLLRLNEAKKNGCNLVLDLQFSHLMAPNEIHSSDSALVINQHGFQQLPLWNNIMRKFWSDGAQYDNSSIRNK